MAQFKVKIKNIEALASDFHTYNYELNSLAADIERISSNLSMSSSVTPALKKMLGNIAANIRNEAGKVSYLGDGLSAGAAQYKDTEGKLIVDGIISVSDIAGKIQNFKNNQNPGWEILTQEFTHNWDKIQWEQCLARYRDDAGAVEHILKLSASLGFNLSTKFKKTHKRDDEKTTLWHEGEKWTYDNDGNRMKIEDKETEGGFGLYDKKHTLFETGVEGKKEKTLVEREKEFENGSVNAKLLSAEAHASLKAGLYTYDKNNNMILAPAVAAEIGGSVCVATASGKGKLGDDYYNVSAEGSVSLGKAEAKAETTISFIGEDGKINPQADVKLSAEAVLAEAEISGGMTIAGAEAKVKGSANFGFGAHADVGYKDGKIKFDVGASVGIGASIGFELDTTGLVKGLCSDTKSLMDSTGKLADGVLNLIKTKRTASYGGGGGSW